MPIVMAALRTARTTVTKKKSITASMKLVYGTPVDGWTSFTSLLPMEMAIDVEYVTTV